MHPKIKERVRGGGVVVLGEGVVLEWLVLRGGSSIKCGGIWVSSAT